MNAKIESLEFDVKRLKGLMNLWANPSETASPLFIAMNIADFTERVYRLLTWFFSNGVSVPDEHGEVLERAEKLIKNDARIPEMVLTNISFDLFLNTLKNFLEDCEEARLCDYEIEFEAGDLADHYFTTELVLMTMERLIKNPPVDRSADDIKAFRKAYHDAVNGNYDLAEAARDYAEGAPGGPGMEPWSKLLEHAPDELFDTVLMADIMERNKGNKNDSV